MKPEKITHALLGIVLALSAWTVKKVSDMGEEQAAMRVQIRNLERVVYSNPQVSLAPAPAVASRGGQ